MRKETIVSKEIVMEKIKSWERELQCDKGQADWMNYEKEMPWGRKESWEKNEVMRKGSVNVEEVIHEKEMSQGKVAKCESRVKNEF